MENRANDLLGECLRKKSLNGFCKLKKKMSKKYHFTINAAYIFHKVLIVGHVNC